MDNASKISEKHQVATFGAGCFWGVELMFSEVPGVVSTSVGYSGGTTKNPTYEQVCTGDTGHAEVVEVIYDPGQVSYENLLTLFWENHNPTTRDRQGPDIGSNYRSAVFYHNEAQKKAALDYKDKLDRSGKYSKPVVTEVTAAGPFYKAEEYHQQYLKKRGKASCRV